MSADTRDGDGLSRRVDELGELDATGPKMEKLSDRGMGFEFEIKLATLFIVRAIKEGYEFELTMDKVAIGGKFDDLIFRYKVPDPDKPEGYHWRYRFMQAKHKGDKTKREIAKETLLSMKDDYGLVKYFDSFTQIKERGDDIHDCIICTNINFKHSDVDGTEFKLNPVSNEKENILRFETNNSTDVKQRNLFNLELSGDMRTNLIKLVENEIKSLASKLKECSDGKKAPSLKDDLFKKYHVALIEENVLDRSNAKSLKLRQSFVDNLEALSTGAKSLRQALCSLGYEKELVNWKFQRLESFGNRSSNEQPRKLPSFIKDDDFNGFCQKLLFAVNMPSISELDDIISDDLSNYYDRDESKRQFRQLSDKVKEWFNSQNKTEWLASNDGKKILMDGVTKQSIDYRKKLMEEELVFNRNAIESMTRKLEQALVDLTNKVVHIFTSSPKWTAIKIISAIETWPEYKASGKESYWVTSSNSLLNKDERCLWKNRLELTKGRHFLLIVDDDNSVGLNYKDVATLIPDNGNKVIYITRSGDNATPGTQDEIYFADLNDVWQKEILSKRISFQGKEMTVGNLIQTTNAENQSIFQINQMANKIIDSFSIRELMGTKKRLISIPSFSSTRFEQSLYIKRRLTFPLNEQFHDEGQDIQLNFSLKNEVKVKCLIKSNGKIQWNVQENQQKQEALNKIKEILELIKNSSKNVMADVSENKVVKRNNSRVIIMGVAGTGKSTILSHFYEQTKMEETDKWVIKLNLVDHLKALSDFQSKTSSNQLNQDSINDFLINLPAIGVDQSPFARLLLRHRLETGDRIILMFDGFDEIDDQCQENVIQLINNLNKSVPLYITTRPHMADKLQFELSQLAYNLIKFNKQDQINYLTSIWTRDGKMANIQHFATLLIDRVSENLNDQETNFIGIPLQCRILAECFQSKIQNITEKDKSADLSILLKDHQHFDLATLYRMLIETKRQVFHNEKIKTSSTDNHLVDYLIEVAIKQIESYIRNLAIETVVQTQEHVDLLRSIKPPLYQSDEDREQESKKLENLCISFGLLDRNHEGEMEFLHRTYAEYLVADYIYKGFILDKKTCNKLLENESVRQLITTQILVVAKYHEVRVFLDSMLKNLTEFTVSSKEENQIDIHQKISELPKCLHQLVISLVSPSGYYSSLKYVIKGKYNNITKFVLNCLHVTFVPSRIRKLITRDIFDFNSWGMEESSFVYELKPENFRRLLAFYDQAADDEWYTMFNCLCHHFNMFTMRRVQLNQVGVKENFKYFFAYVRKHGDRLKRKFKLHRIEVKENLKCIIAHTRKHGKRLKRKFQFRQVEVNGNFKYFLAHMKRHKNKNRKRIFDISYYYYISNEVAVRSTTVCFIQIRHLNELLPELIEFLSAISSDVSCLITDLFKYACKHKRLDWEIGRATETLDFLDNLIGFNNAQMGELSRLILVNDFESFQRYYQQHYKQQKEIIDSLTVSDRWGMTCLHRAVLINDTQTVDRLLNQSSIDPLDQTSQKNVKEIIDILVNAKDGITPLYVALVACNKKAYHTMLNFFKQFLTQYELSQIFTKDNQCFYRALIYAVRFEKEETAHMTLTLVITVLGFDVLAKLLNIKMPERSAYRDSNHYLNNGTNLDRELEFEQSVLLALTRRGWFNSIVDIVVGHDEINGYKQLNNLIFNNLLESFRIIEKIEVDILQRIIAARNLDDFATSILQTNFRLGFELFLLSEHFLNALDGKQRSQLVDIFTSAQPTSNQTQTRKKSYWTRIFDDASYSEWIAQTFMNIYPKMFNENDLGKLFFHDGSVFIQKKLLLIEKEKVDKMLLFFSQEFQREFRLHLNEKAPRLIEEVFFNKNCSNMFSKNWLAHLLLFLDYGTEVQLSKFVKSITNKYSVIGGECLSIWEFIMKRLINNGLDLRYYLIHIFPPYSKNQHLEYLMQRISDKLGENAVRDLILQDNGRGTLTLRPDLLCWDYDRLYQHLSKEKKDEIRQRILTTPEVLNEKSSRRSKLVSTARQCNVYVPDLTKLETNLLEELNLILLYDVERLDDKSLQEFIQCILTAKIVGRTRNIWSEYIDEACQLNGDQLTTAEKAIRKFMQCITNSLGVSHSLQANPWMQKLMSHNNDSNEGDVISRVASSGNFKLFDALLSHFNKGERTKTRQGTFDRLSVLKKLLNKGGPEYLLRLYLTDMEEYQPNNIVERFNQLTIEFVEILDHDHLSQFVELILSVDTFRSRTTCIWSDYIGQVVIEYLSVNEDREDVWEDYLYMEDFEITSVNTIQTLLNCVGSHLGEKTVKDLLFYEDANGVVFQRIAALQKDADVYKIMQRHITEKDQEKFERKNDWLQNDLIIQLFDDH